MLLFADDTVANMRCVRREIRICEVLGQVLIVNACAFSQKCTQQTNSYRAPASDLALVANTALSATTPTYN